MRKAVDRVHTQEVILGSVQGALALTAKEKILSFTTLFLQLKGLLSLVRRRVTAEPWEVRSGRFPKY
jgi:hypothetical protein